MINIAICDDDKHIALKNETITREILTANSIGFQIFSYSDGMNLLQDITDGQIHFDLLLLDIEMPFIDGMHLVEKDSSTAYKCKNHIYHFTC